MGTKQETHDDENNVGEKKAKCIASTSKLVEASRIVKPYGKIFHPGKTWIDTIFTFLIPYVMPVWKLKDFKPSSNDKEMMEFLKFLRSRLRIEETLYLKRSLKSWSKTVDCDIVECIFEIPRRKNILQEWGILKDDDDESIINKFILPEGETIQVVTRFPSSLLPEDEVSSITTNVAESGCKRIESIDFNSFSADVPLLIYFHGGAYIMGTYENGIPKEAADLAHTYKEICEKEGIDSSASGLIYISVKYSLAPEYPFPASTIDALSVISYILESYPSRKIHIGGVSAGGHLALSAVFETYRKFPGRVLSAYANVPMVSPSADSMSYYLNSKSAAFVTPGATRFGWQVFLGMEQPAVVEEEKDSTTTRKKEEDDDLKTTTTTTTIDEIIKHGSNYNLWMESKWKKNNNTRRLVDILYDIPIFNKDDAPKFLITTNQADILHDEGVIMVHTLKKQKNLYVMHTDATGEHYFGYMIDTITNKKRLEAWTKILWQI